MKISLCTPTRGRYGRFYDMVQSVMQTAVDIDNVEIIAWLDADEDTYQPLPHVTYHRGPRPMLDGYTQMAGLWTRAWEKATGDIAMMCADDVMFETHGWDERVRDVFRHFPDRIVMVSCANGQDDRPYLPFVSREWTDAVGFTPDDLQGWFADEWIWSMAAEVGRVVFLDDVVIRHNQFGMDQTYSDGIRARDRLGGLERMRETFYSVPEVERRDKLLGKLRAVMDTEHEFAPGPRPQWYSDSLRMNQEARDHARLIRERTLPVVHCYNGDTELVKRHLPVYLHHTGQVLLLSPADAPVRLRGRGIKSHSVGKRGYFGQDSLDRQRAHLEYLLTTEYDWFLLNDADSMCLDPVLPRYLYEDPSIAWSNEVQEARPHWSPYPKIAMQPPYFLSRSVIVRMLSVADMPEVQAHPITPYIDWYMVALCEEAGIEHRSFPDGASWPAWGWNPNTMPETQQLGHDPKHEHDPLAPARGDVSMIERAKVGTIFIHSVKHKVVFDQLVATHADYVRRGRPKPNTITMEEYVQQQQETVRVAMFAYGDDGITTRE